MFCLQCTLLLRLFALILRLRHFRAGGVSSKLRETRKDERRKAFHSLRRNNMLGNTSLYRHKFYPLHGTFGKLSRSRSRPP